MKLSDRLERVISFAEPAGAAADIGTDHGYVPVELVRRGVVTRALAMDVRKGPLNGAAEHIKEAGLSGQIETRLSDGLSKLKPGEADCVVIAGMGGELMIRILSQGRHVWESVKQWVLSPQSEIGDVRRWLFENGFLIGREDMVKEDGKFYTIMDVSRGNGALTAGETADDFSYSPYLIGEKHPVFLEYLKQEEKKLAAICGNLETMPDRSERAEESLRGLRKKLEYNQEVQHEMQRDH